MDRLNYQHLYYFWVVAKHGSIAAACEVLHLAQPTISGQLAAFEKALGNKLFRKEGRRLALTETGRGVYHYADEIFALGRELSHMLKGSAGERAQRLSVGIGKSLPKLVVYRLLEPLLSQSESLLLQCHEDRTDRLLAEIGLHSVDLVLSDMPATPASGARVFNHFLGQSAVALFAVPDLAERYRRDFPRSLNGAPFLLPTANTALRRSLDQWFDSQALSPTIRAELEDSALMKTFAASGAGLFFSPLVVAGEIQNQYGAVMLGRAEGVFERFYAITAQRRLKNPWVSAVLENAQQRLFELLAPIEADVERQWPLESLESQ